MGLFDKLRQDARSKEKVSSPNQFHGFSSQASEIHPNRNEDRCFSTLHSGGVFDGITGVPTTEKGHIAASTAMRELIPVFQQWEGKRARSSDVLFALRSALISADVKVADQARILGEQPEFADKRVSYGTTATAFVKYHNEQNNNPEMGYVHAGDSRLFVLRGGKLESVTIDQLSAFDGIHADRARNIQDQLDESDDPKKILLDAGLGRKANICSFVGSGVVDRTLQTGIIDLHNVQAIIVVSDAVTDQLKRSEIEKIIKKGIKNNKSATAIAQDIVQAANKVIGPRRKTDDCTAVVNVAQKKTVPAQRKMETVVGKAKGEDLPNVDPEIAGATTFRELKLIARRLQQTDNLSPAVIDVLNKLMIGRSVPDETIKKLPENRGFKKRILEIRAANS